VGAAPEGRLRKEMLMKGSATAKADRAPLFSLGVVVLSALALLAPEAAELTRSGLARGELWRLFTGHLSHFSLYHFVVDAGTFAILGSIVERRLGAGRWALLLSASALLISLAFLGLEPSLESYRGLSGLDCAAFAAALILEARTHRGMAILLAAGFAAKLAFEQTSGGFLFPSTNLGDMGLPVLSAHSIGAAAGVAMTFVVGKGLAGNGPTSGCSPVSASR